MGAGGSVGREMLMRALTTHGEAIAQDDLAQCLRALVGTDVIDDAVGGKTISAASFASSSAVRRAASAAQESLQRNR